MNEPFSSTEPASQPERKLREVRFEYTPHFPSILQHCQASLLVSTYQAGKLAVIGMSEGRLTFAFHNFEQAMGIAVHPHKIALGTRTQIWFLQAAPDLAPQIAPANTHDACYLARTSLVTGSLHVHEMGWGTGGLWVVNTLFSCLATLHDDFSFVPRWRPPFISALAAEDRCHLNGFALDNGRPRFVTVMARTDTPGGWRPTKATSGAILDVASGEVVTEGFAMPHSPRWHSGKLWVLDSGFGRVSCVDLTNGQRTVVAEMPGYTRGLAFHGQFAFVGLSRIRETAVFGGLPIEEKRDELKCGVGVIDLASGQQVAALQFHSGVEEIFDVQVLPGVTAPVLQGPQPQEDDAQTIWLVPREDQAPKLDDGPNWLSVPKVGSTTRAGRPASSSQVLAEDPRQLVRMGVTLHENGRIAEAIESFRRALMLDPNSADAQNSLGNVLQDADRRDEAVACYREAIRIQPRFVAGYRNLGYLLKEEGKVDEGMSVLEHAQSLEPNDIIRMVMATALPPIYDSLDDLRTRRDRLLSQIGRLVEDDVRIDVTNASAPTLFLAAYQGQNDRDIQRMLATRYRAPQPKKSVRSRSRGDRIRLGMISRHFRNHTIGRLNLGLARELPRDRFEVTVISVGRHTDAFSQMFRQVADRYVDPPVSLPAIRDELSKLDLDILHFADVGMDTLTYTLSLSRFAPVQCVAWGHPMTTGSPEMDYFLSSETLETAEADGHYVEKLVRLPVVNSFYYRPEAPTHRTRESFGLRGDSNLYLCFQSLFKIHPDFDEILRGILEADPRAEIVLMEGKHGHWTHLLQERFRRTLGAHAQRVRFLPGQSHPDFMSLNAAADVSLDPLHFGGGNTTYEALAIGLPVITLPSQFLRGRITNALYQQMRMTDCVAASPKNYIDLALRFGTDRSAREAVRSKILASCGVLYEDRRVIDSCARFFEEAVRGAAGR